MQEEQVTTSQEEEVSFVDEAMGGDSHSPEPAQPEQKAEKPMQEEKKSAPEGGKPEDSAPKEPTAEERLAEYQARIDRLDKRLRDTQSKLHAECSRRAELQKELDGFEGKAGESDDWFSDEDVKRREEISREMRDSDERLRALDEETASDTKNQALDRWNAEADVVKKDHPDFEDVVYGYLGDLIDEKSGKYDPVVKAAWDKSPDRSPKGAYAFAVRLRDNADILSNPDAYRERVRREIQEQARNEAPPPAPAGHVGLGMVNSAPGGTPAAEDVPDSFVSAVFK